MMEFLQVIQNNTELREHQVLAKTKIFEAWQKNKSVMLQMPTGTGKTYLFTSIIKDIVRAYKEAHKEINILVVAHRTELLEQISATLGKFGIPHGFIQGTRQQHLWRRVQVGSIMSLLTEKNYVNMLRQKFDYIIVDEAHHSLAESYVELFKMFPDARKLGVTATPWRLNHESFMPLYQDLILSPQISWFIQRKLLADFEYVSIKPDSKLQKLVNASEISKIGEFVNSDLDKTFNNQRIRSKLLESYRRYAQGRKGIVYAINKLHASRVAEMYSNNGVKAVAIDCDTPKNERENLISLFKAGEVKVLVNVDIFTEGFDCPDVSFIQLARPTRSLALYLQQVGRGLRISEGKEKTIILDNVGLYNYFGLPDADRKWKHHFIGNDDVEKSISESKIDKTDEISDYSFDESKLEEDDEPMMLVRGIGMKQNSEESNADDENNKDRLGRVGNNDGVGENANPIEEFTISDYYVVKGNHLQFKIYPIIKDKRGISKTADRAVFESSSSIVFGTNPASNKKLIEKDVKLQSILIFVAKRIGLAAEDIYNVQWLAGKAHDSFYGAASLFDVLKMMSLVKR